MWPNEADDCQDEKASHANPTEEISEARIKGRHSMHGHVGDHHSLGSRRREMIHLGKQAALIVDGRRESGACVTDHGAA